MSLRLLYDAAANVAMTGSSGYIGSSFKNAARHSFQGVSHLDDLAHGCTVLHLAASVDGQDRQTLLNNVAIDSEVLDWAVGSGARIVYVSTNNVYSKSIDCRVGDRTRALDYYSASKAVGESLFLEKLDGRCIILRLADVFGVGQRHGAFFRAVEASVRSAAPLIQIGEGQKLRTYIYIAELIDQIAFAVELLKKRDITGIFNVGHRTPMTIRTLLQHLSEISRLPIDLSRVTTDSSHEDIRTMQILPFFEYRPEFTMQTALQHYIDQLRTK